jgi:hypothetical protein
MTRFIAAAALAAALTAHAQDAREELQQLKKRVEELEKRTPRGESAFNPGISVILQGTFARSSQDPDTYTIGGFIPSGGEVGPARRGFSLAESELVMAGSIDPYFRGLLIAALTPDDELEVEEAYVQTLALGRGFTLRFGRFLSGIGYQNEIHQHAWDFVDAPLAYAAFLGGRRNDDGVQLRWLAPSDLFVELGAELGRGRSFPASDTPRHGAGAWTVFGHLGGDVGEAAWRAGLSHLRASPQGRAAVDADALGNEVLYAFTGRSRLWIADAVVKWGPAFKLQAEYFRRREDGELSLDPFTERFESRQSGFYAQAVYQFMPRWRVGARYDRLSHGSVTSAIVDTGTTLMAEHDPSRRTAMVDWSPTEFSRLRLQAASDKSRAGVRDNQIVLQYIHSLGAHGAHRF